MRVLGALTCFFMKLGSVISWMVLILSLSFFMFLSTGQSYATSFTETVPNGNGPIPATFPPVGGTMFVFIGANGNIYYQFVNPSTQFEGFQFTGTPTAFQGNPFQLGPTQALNCGPTACIDYFGGSIVEGYARLTARDGDACAGNFDFNDVFFEVNGIRVGSFSGPETVERTSRDGLTSIGFENCFRNQGSNETSTGWFDLTPVPGLLDNILTTGGTTPFVFDNDGSTTRGDNFWFFRDGNDATGTPEVAPGITIVKSADRSSYSAVGDIINYSFLVTNVGSVQLTNVVVTDSFITGAVSCPQTVLASGEAMTCSAQHTVTQQNIDDDVIFRNVAEVTATPTEGTLGAVSGELEIPGPAANNSMTITKVPSITSGAEAGNIITYTYEIRNTGNITLNSVNVSDAHNGVGALSAVTPTNVSLAPGASQEFTATYTVQQGDVDAQADITNVATAEAVPVRGTIVEPTANAAVSVIAANPVLTLDKNTTTTDFTIPGDTIAYTYEVTNSGNVSITAPITVSDDVINAAGGNVICPAIPAGGLAPGSSLICNGTYSVTQADVDAGTVTNIAEATDGTTNSNQDTVTVTGTQTPEISIDKRLVAGTPTSYDSVGDILSYEYEVRNTGNVTITSPISVSDNLIASVTCPALPAGGLAPDATLLCTASYQVTQTNIDDGSVTNVAEATDGNVTSAPDDVTVNATQLPALSLTKDADPIQPEDFIVGATVSYTFVVTNSGNTTIVDPITVNDNRIPSVSCPALPAGGLLPTQTITCNGSYVVDANDVALFEVTNVASATDGNVTSAQVSETIPLGGVPSLNLTKTAAPGSTFAAVGDTITYSFEILNDGNVSFATPITITDNTIPGSPIACYTPSASDPDFAPGESLICTGTFVYSVDQADLDAAEVVNEATANTTFMQTTPVISNPSTATVTAAANPSLALTKSALPATFASVGESIAYTIAVNNDGNQTLTNVMVTDPLVPSFSCTIPTLAPGVTDTSCVANYTVDQDDIDAGQIDNTASATGTTPQGGSVNGTDSLTIDGPAPAPSVEIAKSASVSPLGPVGSVVNYSFTVENTGNVRLSNITVTDPIDPGFSCVIPGLDPGVSDATTCQLSYTVTQDDIDTGSITNEASVTATSADPSGQSVSDADEIVTPGPARTPAIELEKIADASGISNPAQVGELITYTFRVQNTGNVTLENVNITDPDAVISGAAIPVLAPGAVDTVTFTATKALSQADINAGTFQNQATVSADTPAGLPALSEPSDDPSTGTDDDPTIVTLPVLPEMELVKTGTLDDGGDGRADVGDTINYVFTVENTGNVTLTNISINDPIVTVAGGPIATLEPGQTDTLTFTASYVLTQTDINRGEVENSATAMGTAPDGSTVSDVSDDPAVAPGEDDSTVIPITREPGIELEKVATLNDGGDGVDAGDTIDYVFTVTNTGNVPLTNVSINDVLVTISGGPVTLAPGAVDSTTFTATYIIQQADVDAGSFTNTATVSGTDPQNGVVSDVSDDPADATGVDDPTTVDFPQTPSLSLEKTADTSAFSSPPVAGDQISYSFRVENTGNVTLTNVTVTDPGVVLTGGPIATLLPGQVDTTTYTAVYTLLQADIDAGSFSNQANVEGNPPTGPPVSDTSDDPSNPAGVDDPTVTPIQQSPALTTVKDATIVNFANVNDQITYEYTVTNTGNTSITSPISITDNLIDPADLSCPALPAGGLSPVAPNNTIICTGVYTVTQADLDRGTVTNLASATDGTTTSPTVSETIPDGSPAALTIVKSTTNPPFTAVGEIITYSYEITNNGGRTLTGTTEVFDDRISGPISCFTGNLIPVSSGGTPVTCTAEYTITQADLDSGSVTNEAYAENDNVTAIGTVTSPTDTVTLDAVQNPSVSIEKVGTPNFSTPVAVGDEISYQFTVTNTGNVTLTNIIVSDPDAVVTGTPIVSLPPEDPTASVQANVDTTTYTAIRTLTQADIDAGEFVNQASVRATPPAGAGPEVTDVSDDPANPTGEDDPTVISIPQSPAIEIEKTATLDTFGDGVADVGDEILYSFRVVNTGNVTLSNISIADPDAVISGGPITLSPTAEDTATFTGVHVLTQNDIDAGTFSNQATVSATPPGGAAPISEPSDDPATAGTDDDPTVITIPQNPSMTITKVGTVDLGSDGILNVGDAINYAFRIENTGNVTLSNISITDPDAVVSGGPLLALVPEAVDSTAFTAQRILTQDDIDAGEYENQATANSQAPDGSGVSAISDDPFDTTGNDDPTIVSLPQDPSISVEKVASVDDGGDGSVDAGDAINYTFTVTNTGNVTLTNITLTDPNATVSGGPITSLPPQNSDTTTFTAQHILTQAEIDSGSFENQATVSGTPPNGVAVTDNSDDPANPAGEDDPTVTPLASTPSIAVEKVSSVDDGGDGSVDAGDTINYTFTVTNTGNVTLTNITLDDPNATVSGGPIPSLEPGVVDTATFTAQHVLTLDEINSGSFENQATVTGTPPSGPAVSDVSDDPANPAGGDDPTVTPLSPTPSIAVEKVAALDDGGDGTIDVGDSVTYTFTVTNTGNVTLSDITIDDPNAVVSGGPITLDPNGVDTTTFTAAHVLTQAEINSGSFENQATVSGTPPNGGTPVTDLSDDPADPAGENDPTTILIPATPSISVEKVASVDDGGDGSVDAGDVINYTFTVTNTGNVTLSNITLDDPNATVTGGPILSLDSTQVDTATFTAQHVLTQDEINSGSFENQATVSGTPPSGPPVTDLSDDPANPAGEDDPTVTPISQTPSIAVEKVATVDDGGDGSVDAGDVINYTFTVTNTGNVTLTDITLDDPNATVSGGPILSLLPGVVDTASFTAQHVLTLDEINSGSFENQATVSGTPPSGPPVTDVSDDPANPNGDDDPTVTPLNPTPSIAIEKTATVDDGGDGVVDAGDTIVYAFRIENTGNVTLNDILVTDPGAVVTGGPISLDPGAVDTTTITAVHTLTQDEINSGSFENQATVSGTPPNGPAVSDVSDDPANPTGEDDPTVTLLTPTPSIAVEKVADISGFDTPAVAGNEIRYTFTVTNTGNVTLSDITLDDPDATVTGGPITALLPGVSDSTTFTAVRVLTQDDINSGSFTNQATVSGNPPTGPPVSDLSDDPANAAGEDDPTVTNIPLVPAIGIEKSLTSVSRVFPFIYDIVYEVRIENIGNATLNNLRSVDDLSAALAPADILSTTVSATGFAGTGSVNSAYDGEAITDLLIGNVQLDPTEAGTITINVRANFFDGYPSQGNTATATSDAVTTPVSSNDPSVTPGDPSDVNPTPAPLQDADGDGAPDNAESSIADRDGDGIPDAQDYDPTGYFYCQENNQILSGGLISVTGPFGTQTGAGTSSNITIVRDGSDGSFQFFVSAPGTYTMNVTLPQTGVASDDRLPLGTLDATSLLPANPAVLGAGEVGNSRALSDPSAGANPFYYTFEIEAGDPAIFNNNIPLMFCGEPAVTASKVVSGTPTIQSNGNTQFTFNMAVENTGVTQVNDVSMQDNLSALFGAGNFSVVSNTVTSAPAGFGAGANNSFNGAGDIDLLQSGGILQVGERVEVQLVVELMANNSGTFTNTVTAGGASPLDGTAIPTNDASTSFDVIAPTDLQSLQVEKVAARPLVRLGEILPYTITVRNPANLPRIGVNIVDFLPAGFIYRPDSARIDGVATEPQISGRRLVFAGQNIPASGSLTLTLNVAVSASASEQEFVNRAWIEDPDTGDRISNVGTATVRREIEPVFDCSDIIGKVYDDQNRNGYQDDDEPGLPGVRVATVKGELITTDKNGRYHVPCASIPDASIGSNFILKLDVRTLPTGYRVTTENPRVVRLTRGKLTKINFGASISRVVRIDLNSAAFVRGDIEPSKRLSDAIGSLVQNLAQETSILRLSYQAGSGEKDLAKKRMRNISNIIRKRWDLTGGDYDLEIETRIVSK